MAMGDWGWLVSNDNRGRRPPSVGDAWTGNETVAALNSTIFYGPFLIRKATLMTLVFICVSVQKVHNHHIEVVVASPQDSRM